MSNVVELGRGVHLSIRGIADEIGHDRDTVAKRILLAKIKPSGKKGGHPVYRLKEVLRAMMVAGEDGDLDPDKLPPFERHAFYKSEREKMQLQVERSELVPAMEVEQRYAQFFKTVGEFFDTLPDVLERDCGASGAQLVKIESRLDAVREALYSKLVVDDADGSTEESA